MKKTDENNEKVQYLPLYMCIGISIGSGLGAVAGNIPVFMCIGLALGVGIGAAIDASNRKKEKEKAENESK